VSQFTELVRLIVAGDAGAVSRLLADDPALATIASPAGAERQRPSEYFFAGIAHYLYRGDTALHMAAAAFQRPIAELLMRNGASCHAKNRRGAQPLHYAADANHWRPEAQVQVIACLASAGADANALDASGTAPLHRAVRTRSLPAVRALVEAGADPRLRNGRGSTPLHLAVRTTGKSGSGSVTAREQQAGIIRFLLERGASPTDPDGRGRRVHEAATGDGLRALLHSPYS